VALHRITRDASRSIQASYRALVCLSSLIARRWPQGCLSGSSRRGEIEASFAWEEKRSANRICSG
jgi:hypothetical protein